MEPFSPTDRQDAYFPLDLQFNLEAWELLHLDDGVFREPGSSRLYRLRLLVERLQRHYPEAPGAGQLNLLALLNRVLRHLIRRYLADRGLQVAEDGLVLASGATALSGAGKLLAAAVESHPPVAVREGELPGRFLREPRRREQTLVELFLLAVQTVNPAAAGFRDLFDDAGLVGRIDYRSLLTAADRLLADEPSEGPIGGSLLARLLEPIRRHPGSLADQLGFVRENWSEWLPEGMVDELLSGLDVAAEEEQVRGFGPGPPLAPGLGREAGEPEAFSPDVDWMPRVVLMAKTIYVWLDQLSRHYERPVTRLDEIPDEELDKLAGWGFTSLWLIGIWERSPASQQIKRIMGNPEAVSSAYSLYDYVVAEDLGGDAALEQLRRRCVERGIRLACDVVPNHTGIYSRWVREHPDWFIQADHPPYPAYRFTGPDLSLDPDLGLFIEDGYWNHSDAAVVFRHEERRSGRVRYIYHGNDGTHMPWNDTAQLNYLLPEVREAVIRTVIEVARRFPVIRFDAAMTLAKKHFQRLWFPQPGGGAGVPSRTEHALSAEAFERAFPQEFWRELVDRVAAEVPDTLLLAEAFWLMEGYFVRTLGMHRVYNSAFMNMLKQEENAKYRRVIQEILEFNPEILKRFVNFMNNPDEATAVEQFGKNDKYFGTAVMLATLPGLPMFGHGQFEGLREKYGMEYRRAYWEEEPDEAFVRHHEAQICPLLRRRYLFSEVANFRLFDFQEGERVNEDVFAYANRCGEERALVVYHNRAAEAVGRLRLSTPRVDTEGARPLRSSLGEAFGLEYREGRFWRFREHRGGLEYLATGGEWREQGMELQLGPYDYRVFLEFREVRDEDGCWAELHHRLQGRGVPSLERELAAIRFRELREAARRLLDRESLRELALTLDRPSDTLPPPGFGARLEAFLAELHRAVGDASEFRGLETEIVADLERVGLLLKAGHRPRGPLPLRELVATWQETDAEGARPAPAAAALLAAVVLGRIGELTGPGRTGERSADWLERFLLVEVLFPGQPEIAALVLAGVRFARFWDPLAGREDPETLLADGAVQELLQVHWAGGKRWFNRERWDLLTRQLAWLGGLAALASGREDWPALCAGVGQLRAEGLARAEAAGYQVEPLVRSWQQKRREERRALVEERLGDRRRRILVVAPEATPFAKTGGLADVAGALCRELHRMGHDVRLLLPGYTEALRRAPALRPGPELAVQIGARRHRARLLLGEWEGLSVAFVEQEELFDRPGLYGEAGEDYPDNAERFGFFARAALAGTRLWDFRPDVIHLHDWQTSLVAVLLKTERRHDPFFAATGCLLTLHNLGYQGLFPPSVLGRLGLDQELFALDQLEFYGQLSFLKGGVVHADLLNTVSPTYCREILTAEQGHGFEGILQARREELHGLLNGIDPRQWNPATDEALASPYGPGDPEGKAANKAALQRELGLEVDPAVPLAAMVARIDRQKGVDLVSSAWEDLLSRGLQLVVLGTGERSQMERLAELGRRSGRRAAVRLEFDEPLSRRIYAGSDLFLMPSRYEPCGLGQLIALRYGSVPVARRTGGLADTVIDPRDDPSESNGFSFEESSAAGLLEAVDRALACFREPAVWQRLVRRGMAKDFSWNRSAERYLELYRQALEKRR